MLNIFYGRESIDKEKFIYTDIAGKQDRVLVIVPDQYTLEAEKQAFLFLDAKSLVDVEIISMSRLGSRLIEKEGGGRRTFIDKYGRHMLLSQIMSNQADQYKIFKGAREKSGFLEMANNFISEMKQYDVVPKDLLYLADTMPEDSLLCAKLSDLHMIFDEYERRIAGKFTDSEDYINLYMDKIEGSAFIADSHIWVYGFDSFAPKAMNVLGKLMTVAKSMNVFLTYDRDCRDEEIFKLSEIVMAGLETQAIKYGVSYRRQKVGEACGFDAKKETPALIKLEKALFAVQGEPFCDSAGITIVKAANMYTEAESAAAHILHLICDRGLRYRDMVIICNDQKIRASVIGRVFQECGIALFDDKKRSVISSPIAIYIVSLLEVVVRGYRTHDIFKVLKTGFTSLSVEEVEILENYAIRYRIKGSMWKKPFVKGQTEYGDDGLEQLNQIRSRAMAIFIELEKMLGEVEKVAQFIEGYYDYLMGSGGLEEAILDLMNRQKSKGLLDLAEETSQVWNQIVGLLDQIVELGGQENFSGKEFVELLTVGLSELEIGVLPPTSDDLLMGTMQRTRSGNVKAVIVIGANEGILPQNMADQGIFTLEELEILAEAGREICKADKIRVLEEKLAIYRNLSKASQDLWISYSASDEEGKEARPSEIVDILLQIFPTLTVQEDVVTRGDVLQMVGGRLNTLRHLTEALSCGRRGEKIAGSWKAVAEWYLKNQPEALARVTHGLNFTNIQKNLPRKLAELLYKRKDRKELTLSPSRLERFGRCPFSHFVLYGLQPEERRFFEATGREIGDIYHQCLMEISERLTREKAWHTISKEECKDLVENTARGQMAIYRERVFSFSNEERYKSSRIEDACFHVCWALIQQVRSGRIKDSLYEAAFGKDKAIPPVGIDVRGGKILVEGKIDRIDVLEGDRVKIIDYKTGRELFDLEEARSGYRLQLMLYLKAVQSEERKPAGVFYFHIDDPRVDLTTIKREKIAEKIAKDMGKVFRLNGVMVNDPQVIHGIAGEFQGFSDILPLRNSKEGVKATSEGFLLSDEEFVQLQKDVDRQIEKLCGELVDGKISITPKKTDKESACTYCQCRSICRFDLALPGCNFEIVK